MCACARRTHARAGPCAADHRATVDVPARLEVESVGVVLVELRQYQSGEVDQRGGDITPRKTIRCGHADEAAQAMLRSKKWSWSRPGDADRQAPRNEEAIVAPARFGRCDHVLHMGFDGRPSSLEPEVAAA